jgi:hypothetical protein
MSLCFFLNNNRREKSSISFFLLKTECHVSIERSKKTLEEVIAFLYNITLTLKQNVRAIKFHKSNSEYVVTLNTIYTGR